MGKNRLVQIVALLLAVACLAGTSLLAPRINHQRARTLPKVTNEAHPPRYVLAAAALGTFRGLAVDALWYRAQMLKRAGKFYDAKTMRDWITTLQPRFPQVWRFQAWDMAYNISVQTHTPQERWSWVSKGIRLLRQQGIPNNPNAVPLYRELAFMFFFKIGGSTDDMHWYYKARLAERWEELLGAPTQGASTKEALARFKPIADAAERYFLFDKPARRTRQRIRGLARANPALAERLTPLADLKLTSFVDRVGSLEASLRKRRPEVARRLAALRRQTRRRLRRAANDPLTLLLADHPTVRPLVGKLHALGLDLTASTLRDLGRLKMFIRYAGLGLIRRRIDRVPIPHAAALLQIVSNPEHQQALHTLLSYLRAKALVQTYNMNPMVMYQLMTAYGPLDWRHPASHAIYWAYLGVIRSGDLTGYNKYSVLNTSRTIIHAFQMLFRSGRLTYNPFTEQVDMLPDPRFIPAYDKAMKQAFARSKLTDWAGGGNKESFERGHENFLIQAVVDAYLYGQVKNARKYYREVRRLYGNKPQNRRSGRYLQPLDEFVIHQLQGDWDVPRVARAFTEAMLQRGFTQGLAHGRMDIYRRFAHLARDLHRRYQKKHKVATPTAPRERLMLLPWKQAVIATYSSFMKLANSAAPLLERARVYANTPAELRRAAWPQFHAVVNKQARQAGFDASQLFPRPAGVKAPNLKAAGKAQKRDQTVEHK